MTRTWLALYRYPNSGVLFLVAASLLIGLATFGQYGMSWDEPLFYRYAEAITKAYSITSRLNGTFRLEDAYGPSSDHGRYGPAYLLLARWPVLALQNLPGVDEAAAWHLVNFLTFQAGVLVFYLLLRRWVSPLAAWGSAALFATQPVLWGHAFMNPKDMPFMVFFIFSIYTGLRMVDAAWLNSPAAAVAPALWRRAAWVCLALAGMLVSLGLALWLFPGGMAQLARNLLALAYTDPASLPGQIFSLLTVNARNAPLEVYEIKLTRLLALGRWVSLAGALTLGACWALIQYARPLPERLLGWLKVNVPPGPVLLAALALGLTTSIRILGPLAGVIVGLVFLIKWRQRALIPLALYGLAAFLVCYITWPYLWGGPLEQFAEVLTRNANNPERVRLLFAGQITYSDELPPTYLPTMLAWTLTEPTWPLTLAGTAAAVLGMRKKQWDWHTLLPITLWLIAPLVYVFAAQPPLYDGFRHFMFIIPGIFILAALALENILARIQKASLRMGLLLALMSPAIIGYAQLHPYEYAYYNAFSGGTRAVFRQYETEYWLTCYKEAFDYINNNAAGQPVFVQRNLRLAQYYARPGLPVSFIPDEPLPSGSLLLQTTRTNGDQITLPDLPIVHQVQRAGTIFCVTKQVP